MKSRLSMRRIFIVVEEENQELLENEDRALSQNTEG